MRTTILPSMLEILTRNYNFHNKEAYLYEIGKIYFKRADGLADEPKMVSIGMYGDNVDFFYLKGIVETMIEKVTGVVPKYVADHNNYSYHPGRCAKVYLDGEVIGVFGQIHPEVAKNYGVDKEMYCAEISFDKLFENIKGIPVYKPLPKYPGVSRDLAVVCDAEIPVGDLVDCIKKSGGEFLKDCTIFDVYMGHHIAQGFKSVAFTLSMRADDRTMTDEDAEKTVKAVLEALKATYNAEIR